MDASGDFVANIPYDKYLLPESTNNGTVYIPRVLYLGLGDYESSIMKDYPVYSLYVKYVDGLTVKDFNVLPRTCNTRRLNNIR